jgi:transcriptional regulator with XRE-family HTH domain
MNTQINPAAVKSLREKKRISQEKLVRLVKTRTGMTLEKRQLQRIESKAHLPGMINVREKTLNALAHALGVVPNVLQADPEGMPHVQSEAGERLDLTVRLRASTVTKLDLIRSAYKVEIEEIVDLAPLLFAYHAEVSLRERRHRLEADLKLRESLIRAFPKLKDLVDDERQDVSLEFESEGDSLSRDDVFGWWVNPEDEREAYPFTRYLQGLSESFGDPSKLRVVDQAAGLDGAGSVSRIPDYSVCNEHFDWLTGGDPELKQAIWDRRLLIDSIPWDLMLQTPEPRVAWMRHQLGLQEIASPGCKPSGELHSE